MEGTSRDNNYGYERNRKDKLTFRVFDKQRHSQDMRVAVFFGASSTFDD